MASQVLKGVKDDLIKLEPMIAEAKDLVEFMRDAGEDVTEMNRQIRTLEIRKEKWERVLASRNI